MRDEQVRVRNPDAGMRVFGSVAILRELLHIRHTGWMSRKHRANMSLMSSVCMCREGVQNSSLMYSC